MAANSSSTSTLPRKIETESSLITGPTVEPVDLDEVKRALRFTSSLEDTLIDSYISAARQAFENYTGRQLIAATWEYWLECFPLAQIELPKAPLLDVVSVTYLDGSDSDAELVEGTDYTVVNPQGPKPRMGYLVPVTSWPATGTSPKAVLVRYRAGYGDVPGDVPEHIRVLLMTLTGDYHKYRTRTVDTASQQAFSELPWVQAALFDYKVENRFPPVRW